MKKILLLIGLLPLISNAQEEQAFQVLKKHSAPVLGIQFSPDGKLLASGSEDKTAILWSAETYEPLHVMATFAFPVRGLAFYYTRESKTLLTNGDYVIKQWTLDGQPLKVIPGSNTSLWMLSLSPDGKYLTAGTYEKANRIWNLGAKITLLDPLKGHEKNALVSRFSNDSKYIVTGSLDMTLRLWDFKKDSCLRIYKGHGGNIFDVQFSPDTLTFASASDDRNIRIWKIAEDKSIQTLVGHEKGVVSLVYSKDGKYLISGSYDKSVRLWELATGKCIYTYYQKDEVNAISVNPDNSVFAAALNDNTIALWHLNISEAVVNFYYPKEFQAKLDSCPLMKPKDKNETKEAYAKRQQDATKFRDDLIADFYRQYMLKPKEQVK